MGMKFSVREMTWLKLTTCTNQRRVLLWSRDQPPPITAHLALHVCVGGLVGVVLDVETPVRRLVELIL